MSDEEKPVEAEEEPEDGLVLDEDESAQLREVFSSIFPQYLIPLEELVGQLLEGQATPEIIEGLRGAVAPLISAADSIGVTSIKTVLVEFQSVIDRVADADEIDAAIRDKVVDVFYRLKEEVQGAGAAEAAGAAGTAPSDFVARLSAIDGIGAPEVQRVLAAGISTQEHVVSARVDEIAAVTGLSQELAQTIFTAFGGVARKRRPTSGTSGGGSAGGGSDPSRSGSSGANGGFESSDAQGGLSAAALEARLALVAVVRERVRLSELMQQEKGTRARAQHEAEDLTRSVTLLEGRLHESLEELDYEKELSKRTEQEIAHLRQEIEKVRESTERVVGRSGDDQLVHLRDRLAKVKERIAKRSRWG